MNKLIFLDIDGVIATPESIDTDGMWGIVDSKQDLLQKIIDCTDADIVLSSSWRKHELEETKQYMKEKGFRLWDRIIGVTIRAYQYLDRSRKVHLSIPRGVEIKQWIDANVHSQNGCNWNRKSYAVDYTYVILDDDTDMLYQHKDNFLKTSSNVGLTEEIVQKAISILNHK